MHFADGMKKERFLCRVPLVFGLTRKGACNDEQPIGKRQTAAARRRTAVSLLMLKVFMNMLVVGCAAFLGDQHGMPPSNYQQAAEVDLAAQPYDEELLGELALTETAAVAIFYTLPKADTAYLDLRLIGPEDGDRVILHSENYRTDEDGGGIWEQELPAGTYRLVLTAEPGPGVLSVYWDPSLTSDK